MIETGLPNRFVEAFAEEVDYWERALSTVGEIQEMVLSVQKGYVYLDNIFSAEDIRQQLPRETEEFERLTASWKEITSRMAGKALALRASLEPRMYIFQLLISIHFDLNLYFERVTYCTSYIVKIHVLVIGCSLKLNIYSDLCRS